MTKCKHNKFLLGKIRHLLLVSSKLFKAHLCYGENCTKPVRFKEENKNVLPL